MAQSQQIRIATRQSELAMRQSEIVKTALKRHFPELIINLVPMTTTGDQMLFYPAATSTSMAEAGGKGLFIKELEAALLAGEADIAVHSLKDMPAEFAPELELSAFLERDDPRDVLISPQYPSLLDLPAGAVIGTSSLRRTQMVKFIRPDCDVKPLRGNVNTRLAKLNTGEYDAIILAAAGLHRLGLDENIQHYFSPEESLPAIGQGVIAIQSRRGDKAIKKLLTPLDHHPTHLCVLAERAMNKLLGGNCHSPIAGYATLAFDKLLLRGWVYDKHNAIILKSQAEGNIRDPEKIGATVAKLLLAQGAAELLE